ncbi:winged helix-turn-helix DNA-binding domain-containing protein [Synechococcus sp. A18-25c]|uniref:Npun_F0494 family protein n=1 Tax=unclassified Synechococcus TaxID=2626047 RepID=UPI0016443338|nr:MULTISPECIES: Npun_F0494 family protein [unclassified Synechococcus]MEC7898283.1 Npun_F0494 family protein [Cyanobacteriota bacterium]QNI49032.1 winged helix-turn-helix DNA-binding domain-containing protein [Synechococcus sp. A15-60]QNJ20642.1 winged helix-turn-helix DNA-binding domain-containing protein [Synechococcus sp. A18-25c]
MALTAFTRTGRVILQDPSELTRHALQRARQAVRCLPFQRNFYRHLESGAMSSGELVALDDWPAMTRQRLNASQTEDHLIWLIQLGVLRREVDGQGLTERVRLTPLGRDVLINWPESIPSAGLTHRLFHWCRRHRPRW